MSVRIVPLNSDLQDFFIFGGYLAVCTAPGVGCRNPRDYSLLSRHLEGFFPGGRPRFKRWIIDLGNVTGTLNGVSACHGVKSEDSSE